MESSQELISFKCYNNKVEEIILNRPSKLNVVNIQMAEFLYYKFAPYLEPNTLSKINLGTYNINLIKEIKYLDNVPKIVFVYGSGNKSFCAGGDVTSLYNFMKYKNYDDLLKFYDFEVLSDYAFGHMRPLNISIWNGYAMGGGLGLSINSRIRIATDNTVFAMPETAIGLYPDVGAAYFLTRIFNNRKEIGLYCGLTGYRVEGKLCAISGAATHYVICKNRRYFQLN